MTSLRPSAAILGTQIALAAAIDRHTLAGVTHSSSTVDLLLRMSESPGGQSRASDLSRQLQLSAGYVSKRIDHAEAAGLIVRQADPTDRRAQVLTLTDVGKQVVRDFRPRLEAVLERVVFDALTDRDVETLIELLGRVESACLDLIEEPVTLNPGNRTKE